MEKDWHKRGHKGFSLKEWIISHLSDTPTLSNLEDCISDFFKHVNHEVARLGGKQINVSRRGEETETGFDITVSFVHEYTKESLVEAMRVEREHCDKAQIDMDNRHRILTAHYDNIRASCEQRLADWKD